MPEKIYVSDLEDDQPVQSTFLVDAKSRRKTRNGDPYLCVTLSDRTGAIEGRIWNDVDAMEARFDSGDFTEVRGRIETWNDDLQIKIHDIRSVDASEVEPSEYLPYSRWSSDEMFDALCDLVDEHVRGEPVRQFLRELLTDAEFAEAFKRAPAATSNHHEYFGGLLEHTLSMTRLGVALCRHYANYYPGMLNRDLVVAGCVLHDAGKIEELSFERTVSYSTEGKLVGHIAQGVELIGAVARRMDPPPPDDLLAQLKHLVLSHHGHREFGSPVEPRTPEATLLHEVDMIDSRMNLFHSHLEEHRAGPTADAPWTSYHRTLESDIFAGPENSPDWSAPSPPDAELGAGPGLDPNRQTPDDDGDAGESDEDDSETLDLFAD